MKKLYVVTALALAGISLAGAEGEAKAVQTQTRPMMVKVITQEDNQRATTTGDVDTDSQVKALTKEMEAKIQAIRSEYMTKIKAIIASKKATIRPIVTKGTTTPPGMERGEKKGFDEGNKLGRPFVSSTTSSSIEREKDDNSKSQSQLAQKLGARIQGLLNGFFGR